MPSNLRQTARAIAMAFATLALLDGMLILDSIQAQGIPSDWVAYYRPGRLVVPHPPGWQVQEGEDGAFVVLRQATGSLPEALVFVKPQRFSPTRSAADVLGLLPRDEAALFPDARLLRASALEPPMEGVLGAMTHAVQGQRYRGSALVLKIGLTGALYVISATEATWSAHALTMTRILDSFRYVTAAASGDPLPPMVLWRDPIEGSFTVPVPQGWRVDGGMRRPNPIAYRPEIVVASPDDTIHLRLGDAAIPTFGVPYTIPMVGTLPEGTTTAGYTVLRHYRPGAMFLTQLYLPNKFGGVANVQVEELPLLAAQSFRLLPPAPPMQGRADAGAVRFAVQLPIGLRRAYYAVITRYQELPGVGGSQSWYVGLLDIVGYLCTPEHEAQARAILGAMYRGFAWDLQWAQAQARANAEIGRLVSQHVREMNEMTAQAIAGQAAGAERAAAPLNRAASGEILVRDDRTGQVVRVPQTGSQHYYRVHRTGEIVDSDRGDLPAFDYRRMTRVD